MSGGTEHQHIAALRWSKDGTSEAKESNRETLVAWVRDQNGQGYAADATGGTAWVHVVNATPPYLRTQKDGVWTDNLLALPTY